MRTDVGHRQYVARRYPREDETCGHYWEEQAKREKERTRALQPQVLTRTWGPLTTEEFLTRIRRDGTQSQKAAA